MCVCGGGGGGGGGGGLVCLCVGGDIIFNHVLHSLAACTWQIMDDSDRLSDSNDRPNTSTWLMLGGLVIMSIFMSIFHHN